MLVSWDWDKPVRCSEHGKLSDAPLPQHDAGILALEHLRDVHGLSKGAAGAALAKVQAHKPGTPAVTVSAGLAAATANQEDED
jgi:hypothetical protein